MLLYKVRVVLDAHDVAEGSRTDAVTKPDLAPLRDRIVFGGAERLQPGQSADIIDVPVQYGASRPCSHATWSIFAVDDTELIGIVSNAELDIGGTFAARHLK